MRRHALPSTLTSAGRVTQTWLPGPAESLHGLPRWVEVYKRLRQQHGIRFSLRATVVAWRHGVCLSGPRVFIASGTGPAKGGGDE